MTMVLPQSKIWTVTKSCNSLVRNVVFGFVFVDEYFNLDTLILFFIIHQAKLGTLL